jgi:ElaB/YqjD/DUF883 family membrane-anchored ribosome-binding protein
MSTHATGTDPGSRSAAEIEREVQQSRADIEHTLDAIQERLSPGQMVDQALGYFRGGRGVDFARNLGDSIAANPIPITLMGVGLAWMMFSGQRSARDGDRGDPAYWEEDLDPIEEHYTGFAEEDMAYLGPEADAGGGFGEGVTETGGTGQSTMSRIGEQARHAGEQVRHAGEQARDAAGQARERARRLGAQARERVGRTGSGLADRAHDARAQASRYGRRAKQGMLRSLDEQPLVLGAIGLAIGAALGAALPPSETEDELMGETRDKALRRATKVGREQAEKVRDAAGAVAAAAREEVGRQAKSSGEAGGAPSGEHAGKAGEPGPGPGASGPAGLAADTPFAADPKASMDRS